MPQPTVEIVRDLTLRLNRFKDLARSFRPDLQGKDVVFSVSLGYLRLRFSAEDVQIDFWPREVNATEDVKKHFASLTDEVNGDVTLPQEIAIAESIARTAYLCTAGDDYHPGYFSEIVVDSKGITLSQVNRTNSRSSAHKDDYLMRDLEFYIPNDGKMTVKFSDRSSKNNKGCGERIRAALESAGLQYGW